MDTQEVGSEQRSARAERVAFYHPNASGTGTAVRIDPKMNGGTASPRNGFFLELAQQKSAATRNADGFVPASFDWEGKITVKLGFQDICEFLAVLEGTCEHAGGKRDGLYHQNGQTSTVIRFKRGEEGGYALGLSRKRASEEEPKRISTVLSDVEATGLKHVFQVGAFFMVLPATG